MCPPTLASTVTPQGQRPSDPWWRNRQPSRHEPELAGVLQRARARRGWTLRQVADLAGISLSYCWRLHNGTRRPSKAVASDLIDTYGLDNADALLLLKRAAPYAGRNSPYHTGEEPKLPQRRTQPREWATHHPQ